MTVHLLRLIWNRKRQNFLLTVEIFFSFLTLFGVVLLGVQYANNARHPVGYQIARVWSIGVDRKEPADDPAVRARHRETYQQLLNALGDMPEIEVVAAGFTGPYSNSSWGSGTGLPGGRQIQYGVNSVTDRYRELLNIEVAEGRWFSREDDAATWIPVVINRRLAREIFGGGSAVGQIIPEEPDRDDPPPDPASAAERQSKRVVGVIDEFRQDGELSAPRNYLFYRMRLDSADPEANLPERIFVRLAPGTPASFEEALVKRAMAVAGAWSFEVQAVEDMRTDTLRSYTTPLMVVGTIAGFLLLMVALGLTGVVWQSVTQRIREFGLRRAKGATISNVRTQVLSEIAIMTSLAVIAAVVLLAQVPLLPLPRDLTGIPASVFIASIVVTVIAIYVLTLACGWQPSRLATRIQPAEALHYE
ncbi:MAG TPA: FtsX-like permease family protein [Vicinamibacterales bacterium]|nr:FtsX-like permease family protein [Vicinamibacterales bacterium]